MSRAQSLVNGHLSETIFQSFRGMNRRSDRLNTNPEFYYDLVNGYCKKDLKTGLGILLQRNGVTKLNSTPLSTSIFGSTTSIKTLFEAKWDSGGKDVIIRAGTAWGKYDGSAAFTSLDSGRTNDVIGQCAMFKNELIMVDGGIPRKSTAAYAMSALSADSNMPQDSTAVWVHRDKVWLNSAATPMIAYFCKTNNADGSTAWTGATDAGTLDLSTVLPEGDTIRGYRSFGGVNSGLIAIICDKYTVIYAAGANVYNFSFLQYFPTTCISINACDYVGKDLVYPSRNNFTSLTHAYGTDDINTGSFTEYIEPFWRQLVSEVSDTTQIQGVYDKTLNLFYVIFPIPNNYQILVYSVDIQNVVGRYTYPFNPYCLRYRLNGDVLLGSDDYVYVMNDGTSDDGTAIPWNFKMPALYFGTPSRYKKPIEFEALLQNTKNMTLYLDYYYGIAGVSDRNTKVIDLVAGISSPWNTSPWNTSPWGSSGNIIYRTSDLLGRGRQMFVELRHSTLDANVLIPWFIFRYMMEGIN